jgi:hypothetical protein
MERRSIFDENGYTHIPLVVSDFMFEDLTDICLKMQENNIDFRKGKVPRVVSLLFTRL